MHASWKFPSGPVVETPCFQCRGYGFDPSSGELGSHMLHGMAWQKIKTYHLCLSVHDLAPLENVSSTGHTTTNIHPPFISFIYVCPSSSQLSSVAQSCLTLCDPMDCSVPGLPVLYQLPELAQTPVHQVGDAIQPSHPLLSPSSPAFNLS